MWAQTAAPPADADAASPTTPHTTAFVESAERFYVDSDGARA